MLRRDRFFGVSFLVVVVASLAGCGERGDRPDLGSVRGTVTLDGVPLDLARVTFEPSKGRPSNGLTNGAGEFELNYLQGIEGAVIGAHEVRISTNDLLEDRVTGKRTMIPETYNTKTILKVEVHPGENKVSFDLKSQGSRPGAGSRR